MGLVYSHDLRRCYGHQRRRVDYDTLKLRNGELLVSNKQLDMRLTLIPPASPGRRPARGHSACSAGGIASGTNRSWTVGALSDGTYYWRACSTDSLGATSPWTTTRSFTINRLPTATLSAPADGTFYGPDYDPCMNPPDCPVGVPVGAVYTDPDGQAGTLDFQLYADPSCGTVNDSGSAGGIASGAPGGWTFMNVHDGTFYWRAGSTDSLGESGAWTGTWSFQVLTYCGGTC